MSIQDKLNEFFSAKLDLSDADAEQMKSHVRRILDYGIDSINFIKLDKPDPIQPISMDEVANLPEVKSHKIITVKLTEILDNYKTPGYLAKLMSPYEE